jgi:hypothetical protein
MVKIPPPLIPESGEPFVDDSYQQAELERKEYSELQSIAAEHPSDDVHGQMTKDELIAGLEGLKRV